MSFESAFLGINSDSEAVSSDISVSHSIADIRFRIMQRFADDEMIPLSVFKGNSSGRAVISYLKIKGHSYSEIARILNRDPRTVWTAYQKAAHANAVVKDEEKVPVRIFSYRGLSMLESLVFYLKDEKSLRYQDIAHLLGKNYQTIRTVYMRALKKIGMK